MMATILHRVHKSNPAMLLMSLEYRCFCHQTNIFQDCCVNTFQRSICFNFKRKFTLPVFTGMNTYTLKFKNSDNIIHSSHPLDKRKLLHHAVGNKLFSTEAVQGTELQSSLYVGHEETGNTAVVEVDLSLATKLQHPKDMEHNLSARGLHADIMPLISAHSTLLKLAEKKSKLEMQRDQITGAIREIVKHKQKPAESEVNKVQLIKQGKNIREQLHKVVSRHNDVEKAVVLAGLKLPNILHPSVPEDDTVIFEIDLPIGHTTKVRSHTSICGLNHEIIFSNVSPGAYFLRGELAKLKIALQGALSTYLLEKGFLQIVPPDMVKTLIMEAHAQNFLNPQKVYTVVNPDWWAEQQDGSIKVDNTLHLCGITPMAFTAYLVKMNIQESCLPLRLFGSGRRYRPNTLSHQEHLSQGLYSVPQANVMELYGAANCQDGADDLFKEFLAHVKHVYGRLNLPYRLMQCSAKNLGLQQCRRIDVELWAPSLQTFIKCGEVAECGEFVSRRLMMRSDADVNNVNNRNYLHTVHCTLATVPSCLAAIIELHQNMASIRQAAAVHFESIHCILLSNMSARMAVSPCPST